MRYPLLGPLLADRLHRMLRARRGNRLLRLIQPPRQPLQFPLHRRLGLWVALQHPVHAHVDVDLANGVDDGGERAGRGDVGRGEDADRVAGRFRGVDGALDIEQPGELHGFARRGAHGHPQDVLDGGETPLHGDGEVAREQEAEWEAMLTWRVG